MTGDYISREAALSAQNKSMNLSECRKRLERVPAADVRPVVNTCETCGYKTEQIRVKPYDGACRYWKLHSIKNEEWCCHWKQREES